MTLRAFVVVPLLALTALAALARGQTPKTAAPVPAGIRTVASVLQVMHAITIPASEALFKAASEPPASDKSWADLRLQALALAESGNLLMIGSRVKDRAGWLRASRAMVDAAAAAARAAEAKDTNGVGAAGDAVYETCENCHAAYLKK